MDISRVFNTYLGMYITQSFCHSAVAFIIIERTFHAWKITDPFVKQRFRILIIFIAIFSMPLYQLMNPHRGSLAFRQYALFDSSRWLNLELIGSIPFGFIFIIIILITSGIFILQELIPLLKHAIESRMPPSVEGDYNSSSIDNILEGLGEELPDIKVIVDEDYILYSTTGRRPVVYISRGIINMLTKRQLRSVIAHEMAHIRRNKLPLLTIIYLFRILMFFNLFILIEFRRIVQEEEKICDDIAAEKTGDPAALAEALEKLYMDNISITGKDLKRLSNLKETLEEYSHSLQIESRIRRLNNSLNKKEGGYWGMFISILLVIMVINYFIV